MPAPVVQTLSQAMADLAPAYQQQSALYDQQAAGLGQKFDAQRAGIDAERGQGFNTINNQATGRGLSFSGIPIDEQATYLSTKYLPAQQQSYYQQNDENLGIQQNKAKLVTDQTTGALSRIDNQQSALNQWNLQQSQQQFTAAESAKDRAASAAQASASRAAADTPLAPGQYLASLFADGYQGDNLKNGWTESIAAGNFASAYGLSRQDALAQIYKFRKQYYGQ